MDIEELMKNIKFTEDEVIFNKEFYENVVVPSMNNAVEFKKMALEFEGWIREGMNKEFLVAHHTALVLVLQKLEELKQKYHF